MRNRQRILVGLQASLGISRWTVQPRLLRRAREDRRHAPVVGARGFRIGAIDHIHYLVGRHSDHRAGFDAGAVLLDRNIPQRGHAEHGLVADADVPGLLGRATGGGKDCLPVPRILFPYH